MFRENQQYNLEHLNQLHHTAWQLAMVSARCPDCCYSRQFTSIHAKTDHPSPKCHSVSGNTVACEYFLCHCLFVKVCTYKPGKVQMWFLNFTLFLFIHWWGKQLRVQFVWHSFYWRATWYFPTNVRKGLLVQSWSYLAQGCSKSANKSTPMWLGNNICHIRVSFSQTH